MTAVVTAFRQVPPFAQGLVRDLRVRWALEEAGLPYEAVLVDREMLATPEHRAWQPFSQVPAYREEGLELFESGAIVLHIARRSEALAPSDEAGFARVQAWVIAALNSVEPYVANVAGLGFFHAGAAWVEGYRPVAEAALDRRLTALGARLEGRDYLEDRFTAADLIMTAVLRELNDCGYLARYPALEAYRLRCEARPAFRRALEAQMAVFREFAPA